MDMLDQLQNRIEEKERRAAEMNREKPDWFSPKQGGTYLIQFLQELSPKSPNYNGSWGKTDVVLPGQDKNDPDDRYDIGLFLYAKEHEAGAGDKAFMSRALCTLESEGVCYAHDMSKARPHEKGWFLKENFYITVAVQEGDKVVRKILKRPIGNSFVKQLLEFYNENEQCITGQSFKVSKDFSKSAPWTIMPTNKPLDVSGLEPYDLARDAVFNIANERQETWFGRNYEPELTEDEVKAQESRAASQGQIKNDPILGDADSDDEEW